MRHFGFLVLMCFIAFILSGCALIPSGGMNSAAMIVSLSDDGLRIVSTHSDNRVLVWDVEQGLVRRVSSDGNIYSAAISPDGRLVAWQDIENVIYISSWSGNTLSSIRFDPVYGQKLSNDGYIFASDIGYGIHRIDENAEHTTLKPSDGRAAIGYGKLLNLSYDSAKGLLLSAGATMRPDPQDLEDEWERSRYRHLNGLTLWDVNSETPLRKFTGNAVKTHATLSPDGQYVVSGCENSQGLVWPLYEDADQMRLANLERGMLRRSADAPENDPWKDSEWDPEYLIDRPEPMDRYGPILAMKFISDRYFLRFVTYEPWVALHEIGSPWPVKYFHLGDNPMPAVHHYGRNEAIATAPETGLLVIAENRGPRLIGYQFDEDELTLTREWIAHPRRGFREASPVSQQY